MRTHLTLSLTATALFLASTGDASGLSTARFGGELGHPTTMNPTAIYYNPGALGLSEGINVYIDGNFAYRLATFEHAEICPVADTPTACDVKAQEFGESDSSVGANYGKASLTNFAAAPMIGASAQFELTDDVDLTAGAAFFVPFGGQSSWDKNEAFNDHPQFAGPSDGVQRWWSIDGTLRSMFISGAVAVSISDLIHVGVSAGVAFSQVNTIRAKTLTNTNSLSQEGRAFVDASDTNVHAGGGIAVTPFRNNDLRLGFSYQMPVGGGGFTMQGPLTVHDGINDNAPQDVDLHMVWPDIFRLGVAYKPTKTLELRLFGDVTRWNLFEDQCIALAGETDGCRKEDGALQDGVLVNLPRNWDVGVGVRAGLSYWVSDEVELMGGAGYDNTAIPDETLEPALLDFHDISVTVGGRFALTEWMALQAAYTHLFYIPRDTTDTNKLSEFEGGSSGPDAGGKYAQTIGVLNLGVQLHFDPFSSGDAKTIDSEGEEREGTEELPDESTEEPAPKPVTEPVVEPIEDDPDKEPDEEAEDEGEDEAEKEPDEEAEGDAGDKPNNTLEDTRPPIDVD